MCWLNWITGAYVSFTVGILAFSIGSYVGWRLTRKEEEEKQIKQDD